MCLHDVKLEDEKSRLILKLKLTDTVDFTKVTLYTKGAADEKEINVPLFDKNGRSFYIKCLIETESAGLCLTFYA